MLRWLLLFFGYSTALLCYKGHFETFSTGQPKFEPFHKLNCSTKRAACASWKTVHPNLTSYFYDCATRCRGRIACCRSDLCNDKWIEEYRNLTREVVEVAANPMAGKANHRHLKVKVVGSRIHIGWKKEKSLEGPQMKSQTVTKKSKKMRKNDTKHVMQWVIIALLFSVSISTFLCGIFICCITVKILPNPVTDENKTKRDSL